MHGYPPPPVPKKLQEMLADYPELIARLQEVLSHSAERSRRVPFMPFDKAVWAIEGRFDSFCSEVRRELEIAEATGDAQCIARARNKDLVVWRARNKMNWIGDEDMHTYFTSNFR